MGADSGRPQKRTEALYVGVRLNGLTTRAEVGVCSLPEVQVLAVRECVGDGLH